MLLLETRLAASRTFRRTAGILALLVLSANHVLVSLREMQGVFCLERASVDSTRTAKDTVQWLIILSILTTASWFLDTSLGIETIESKSLVLLDTLGVYSQWL